ncbi:hypothetical protein GLOTRDRAFT_139984 [Gloeophyllum trabeum ATCC 11539]|uniref:DUF6533 domain-containing protein n=1 Tax=Gloeophyllum trabeum (strain ATCC 11539 / FP-39264 / Madison 617) TaxID=670483 RepID=S7RK77_GLOTA|nr:uncharacterized protein GLOTRDRAFT_139984 [Gloeophyllum trabeum ATCC 11539]EPQ53034.1 hypothetical protein GLOTRDRAFT_139984 [Gloeophyllum trabeum ATCC 11539]
MSDSGVPTITDLGELITLIQGLLNVEYSAVASLTFIVWDIVITFDQEVEYIWSQPARSPLKWLFIFARYFTVIVQIIFALDYIGVLQVWGGNLPVCQAWFTLQSLAIQAVTSTTEAMLMMRVYALYNRNRKVRCGLVVLFASELLAIIPMFAIAIPRMEFTVICTPIASHYSLLFFSWLVTVALGVQSILLALTLNPTLRAIRDGWGRTPIFLTMARDGGWSFLLQFGKCYHVSHAGF